MSEFGKGLTYCLGLFLCHSNRKLGVGPEKEETPMYIGLWFNGAGDHLFDLEIPTDLPVSLQLRLKKFQKKVLNWRLVFDPDKEPTKEDKMWAIQEAKDLLRLIDKYFGIKTKKGDWE